MQHRLKPGFSLLDSDGTVKTGGELIELSDEFVSLHGYMVEPPAEPAEPLVRTADETDGHGY